MKHWNRPLGNRCREILSLNARRDRPNEPADRALHAEPRQPINFSRLIRRKLNDLGTPQPAMSEGSEAENQQSHESPPSLAFPLNLESLIRQRQRIEAPLQGCRAQCILQGR